MSLALGECQWGCTPPFDEALWAPWKYFVMSLPIYYLRRWVPPGCLVMNSAMSTTRPSSITHFSPFCTFSSNSFWEIDLVFYLESSPSTLFAFYWFARSAATFFTSSLTSCAFLNLWRSSSTTKARIIDPIIAFSSGKFDGLAAQFSVQ